MDYSKLTDDELVGINLDLGAQKDAIRVERKKINDEQSRRAVAVKAERMLGKMSDAERAALKQIISGAGGIESKAAVGTPGA